MNKMNTPICDFVRRYAKSNKLRLHMPGHKGNALLGFETLDITEIDGADALYEARGIIAESEANASSLFGCDTYYSTEGSSQCIRAMLYLAVLYAKQKGEKPLILAGRNVHKAFVSAAVLLNFDYEWICPEKSDSYLSCKINGELLEKVLTECETKPTAVYLTSPDYLGNITDIKSVARVCRKHNVLLLSDNAHGAYLKFLSHPRHPIDLGADICCDSAHKTLPVLTGGAYLHISPDAPEMLTEQAKNALAMFGSTSPSYLIMQSLDMANAYLADGYTEKLNGFVAEVDKLKSELTEQGYTLTGDEPLKLTVSSKAYGYEGTEFARLLSQQNIICEFADPDFVVLMFTPGTGRDGIDRIKKVLFSIPKREAIKITPPAFDLPEKVMSAKDAAFAKSEILSASECSGRILSKSTVGCPPAVPIVISGERIDTSAVRCFEYYGIEKIEVISR